MGMNGTMMLLKSMGIDPAEVMQSVEAFKIMATQMSERQARIETKLDEIILEMRKGASRDASAVDDVLDHLALGDGHVVGDGSKQESNFHQQLEDATKPILI